MSTLTGTIRFGGSGIQTAVRLDLTVFPLARGGRVDSGGEYTLSTDPDGEFSATIPGGIYRVSWFVGATQNVGYIDLPDDGGEYVLDDLLVESPTPQSSGNGPMPDSTFTIGNDSTITITEGGVTTVVELLPSGGISETVAGRTYLTTFTASGGSTVRTA
jgi:hypothetical protein